MRIEVTAALPTNVCVFTDGCDATCVQGVPDGPTGCCNLDVVELAVSCGRGDGDDSSPVRFLIGSNMQECYPVSFMYEF